MNKHGNKISVNHENGLPGLIEDEGPKSDSEECTHVYHYLHEQIDNLNRVLRKVLSDTDPMFIRTGRELRTVASETRELIETMNTTAELVSSKAGKEGSFEKSGELIENILLKLGEYKHVIKKDLEWIRKTVRKISDYRDISDVIGTINASFRAVRINMLIQCNARQVSDNIFQEVAEDIESLSKTLTGVTNQIAQEFSSVVQKMNSLEKRVSSHQRELNLLGNNAKEVVKTVYDDIRQLIKVAEVMIVQATSRSKVMAQKVDDAVISIQFHDSLCQRVDHILQSFDDIIGLCSPDDSEVSPEVLGLTYLILDLQYRQLSNIIDEINLIYGQFNESFSSIGDEVEGLNKIFQDSEVQNGRQEMTIDSLIGSLLKSLAHLCQQLDQGEVMTRKIRSTANDTINVSGSLAKLMENVQEMRDQIRVQAVNTIIMADNLGERGRTIQVLAKEINALSDKTGEVFVQMDGLHKNVNESVKTFGRKRMNSSGRAADDNTSAMNNIEKTYREISKGVAAIPPLANTTVNHINSVRSNLFFIQELQDGLQTIADEIKDIRDTLLPWKDRASGDTEEIGKLVERYTMHQERMVHIVDHSVAEESMQIEEDIFF